MLIWDVSHGDDDGVGGVGFQLPATILMNSGSGWVALGWVWFGGEAHPYSLQQPTDRMQTPTPTPTPTSRLLFTILSFRGRMGFTYCKLRTFLLPPHRWFIILGKEKISAPNWGLTPPFPPGRLPVRPHTLLFFPLPLSPSSSFSFFFPPLFFLFRATCSYACMVAWWLGMAVWDRHDRKRGLAGVVWFGLSDFKLYSGQRHIALIKSVIHPCMHAYMVGRLLTHSPIHSVQKFFLDPLKQVAG